MYSGLKTHRIAAVLSLFLWHYLPVSAFASDNPSQVYSKLPVKEVTVFKDGHAFVLHEGRVETDSRGDVVLDDLPSPIMGTFWAYSADSKRKLQCVISSREETAVQKAAVTVEELLKSNPGSSVLIKDTMSSNTYQAEIIRVLEEKNSTEATPNYQPSQKLVLLKIPEGTKAIPIQYIQNITFLGEPVGTTEKNEIKDTMRFKLDISRDSTSKTANVGMAYIQLGIRWIPSYRIEIDGNGQAVVKLQATIINELADLDDVKAHLVIGVPSFAFKDTPDPISFQQTIARLSQHFNPNSSTAYAFSNAVMSQRASARLTEVRDQSQAGNDINLGPELNGMEANEDLFVFSLEHITLKKGQRMVLPIAEYTLTYQDIYTIDLQFQPPLEMRQNFSTDQHLKLARMFHAPKAIHTIRLKNTSDYPLTTAPATIFKNGRVLAQGMMTYASIGSESDLEITTALNIKVKHSDSQKEIIPNAEKWNGDSYSRINMTGTIDLTNFGDKNAVIHIKRSILGMMDEVDQNGSIRQLGHGYDGLIFDEGTPVWWNWCNWPWWWYRFNSIGQARWELELKPQEQTQLQYQWHYYWR